MKFDLRMAGGQLPVPSRHQKIPDLEVERVEEIISSTRGSARTSPVTRTN